MTIAVALLASAFNIFGARRLPMFEGMILHLHILLWFGVSCTSSIPPADCADRVQYHIPAWVLAPKVSAAEVFGGFENFGGWPTTGAAVVLGQLASSSAFAGVDSAAHMAEEVCVLLYVLNVPVLTPVQVRDASRTVPRMMMLTTILNGALGLAATITVCFITTDIERQILNGDPNYPYVEIFAEALDSVGGAVTLAVGGTLICISKTASTRDCAERIMLTRQRHDYQCGCCVLSPKLGLRSRRVSLSNPSIKVTVALT